jgi:hypothetical protein
MSYAIALTPAQLSRLERLVQSGPLRYEPSDEDLAAKGLAEVDREDKLSDASLFAVTNLHGEGENGEILGELFTLA